MAGGGIKVSNVKINGGADGKTPVFKIENGRLFNSYDNGVTWYELGQVKGEDGKDGENGKTGAKLISQTLQGQDVNGGNIYMQVFDDGTVAYFTAPRGPQGETGTGSGGGSGGTSITVDSAFSTTSTNPLQNKVITEKINEIENSIPEEVVVDTELSTESENPVQNKIITEELNNIKANIGHRYKFTADWSNFYGDGSYLTFDYDTKGESDINTIATDIIGTTIAVKAYSPPNSFNGNIVYAMLGVMDVVTAVVNGSSVTIKTTCYTFLDNSDTAGKIATAPNLEATFTMTKVY